MRRNKNSGNNFKSYLTERSIKIIFISKRSINKMVGMKPKKLNAKTSNKIGVKLERNVKL